MAKLLGESDADIALACRVLSGGGLVAIPTETVYGLAAHALDIDACAEIFRCKGRPLIDPLIVHVRDLAQVDLLARWNAPARLLAERFWPGPLTLILTKDSRVPDLVTAGRTTVALRMPNHPLARRVLGESGLPLAAPSANPFGYISPTTAEAVDQTLGHKIGYILDGGPCTVGIESTIVTLADPEKPMILRPGAITRKMLEAALRQPVPVFTNAEVEANASAVMSQGKEQKAADADGLVAPGLLHRHYSPRVPLSLLDFGAQTLPRTTEVAFDLAPTTAAAIAKSKVAVLLMRRPDQERRERLQNSIPDVLSLSSAGMVDFYWLTESGDLSEAARNLFQMLRQLDISEKPSYQHILVERAGVAPGCPAANDAKGGSPAAQGQPLPALDVSCDEGLAQAINNRLERAAAR